MTIEIFNTLRQQQKVELIFDADKITEKVDNETNYQLFKIANFFVEAKTSLEGKFKRCFTAYTLKELPADYMSEIISLPIVVLNDSPDVKDIKKADLKQQNAFAYRSGKVFS